MARLYGVPENHRVVVEELTEIRVKHEEELLHQNQKWWEIIYSATYGPIASHLELSCRLCNN